MSEHTISVVTICLNAEKDIDRTINSVLNQSFQNFEYLIVDGKSTDSTLSIVQKYIELFENKNIKYRIISEKDNGLYDAMNKAAYHADGEWIIYMNAGDELFDESVLEKLSEHISDEYDVLYGDTALFENNKYKLLKAGEINEFRVTNPICHQSALTRTEMIRKYTFDTNYKIAADFDLYLRFFSIEGDRFYKIPMVVSTFLLGGVSTKKISAREKEFDQSRINNNLTRVRFPKLLIMKICLIDYVRGLAIKFFNKAFYLPENGWYSDKKSITY